MKEMRDVSDLREKREGYRMRVHWEVSCDHEIHTIHTINYLVYTIDIRKKVKKERSDDNDDSTSLMWCMSSTYLCLWLNYLVLPPGLVCNERGANEPPFEPNEPPRP